MKVNIIIANAFVMTMEGKGVGMIEDGAVVVKGDSIIDVGFTKNILADYSTERLIDAKGKLVMPGLIDSHIHTGLSLYRGTAQDMSHWMQKGLWPFRNNITETEAVCGSLLNIVEGIKAGTTTFCDFDESIEKIVKNYSDIGARARVTRTINEFPNRIVKTPIGELYPLDPAIGQQKLQENIQLFEEWNGKDNGRITCLFGPQGPDMVSIELLREIKYLAEKYDTKIHMHVAQGDREVNQMMKRYNKRSIPFLDELDYLNERLIAVHLTEANLDEIQLIVKRGASMINCTGSIAITGGNIPPVMEFIEAGGLAALGSDQASGNNCSNMFNEMKFTAILNKVKRTNATVFPAWKMLRMATIEAAQVIGLESEIGSLRKGKKADIIIINLQEPNLSPVVTDPIRNIAPNIVYSANGSEVETVIIDGQLIMDNRKILTVDEEKVVKQAQEAANNLAKRATEDVIYSQSDIYKMMQEGYL